MRRILLIIGFYGLWAGALQAQEIPLSNLKTKTVSTDSLPVLLDSLTILPASLIVKDESGNIIPPTEYMLFKNELFWANEDNPAKIKVSFRVLPYDLHKNYQRLDTTKIGKDDSGDYIGFDFSPYEPQTGLTDLQGLDYNGSFSRGISFGNNQNLVLNSSFNLQLAGTIGNDVEILAAISDNNIPLQPEGNTQQLQEFDRIFIQLKKDNASLIAGDYELARPNSYFMNYFKKLKGATVENTWDIKDDATFTTKASAAIARGKFARNIVTAIEGNQGPYRLIGAEGERFIIVLSGTEKVFIDGQLLTRGLEQDYVIDYNRADIVFTNKRLITKDIRIVVEFEYAVQNYTRTLLAVNTEYQSKKVRTYFNLFTEQDGINSGAARDLDSLQRSILTLAGDNPANALAPGVDTLEEFNQFRVSYKLIDTFYTVSGQVQPIEILQYSTDPDSALFAATFIEVGQGNGDYIIDTGTAANGRVHKWVAPDPITGERRGSLIPGRQLIAPNKRAMYTLGTEYQLTKNSSILTEVAMSVNDLNRFSDVDSEDDMGLAVFSEFKNQSNIGKTDKWQIDTKIAYELVEKDFRSLNPYRNAEFTRDWNLSNTNSLDIESAQEQIGKAGFTLTNRDFGSLSYEFSGFLRKQIYTGTKHTSRLNFKKKGFVVDLQGSLLNVDASDQKSTFFRPRGDISKSFEKLGNWKLGVYGEREKNDRFDNGASELSNQSFYYDLYKVYLNSPQSENFTVGANYRQRLDYAPVNMDFIQNTIADEFNVNGNWRQGKTSNLRWNLSYRKLEISDSTLTNQEPQETFLGRLEHSMSLLKGAIRTSTNYEIGSGQERKQEFQYLPVAPGEGVYIWIADLNGDSIPQLNEIEEAAFQSEANIVRVSIFTDEFIRTNNVLLNQSLRIDPRNLWYQKSGLKKFLSLASIRSNLRILRKTREADDITPWNPFQLNIVDTSLVSTSAAIRNNLFYNQGGQRYDIQIGQNEVRDKVVLTTGFESRRSSEQFLRFRWNFTKDVNKVKITSIFNLSQGIRANDSEFFNNRDYNIDFFRIEPELSIIPFKNFRTNLTYKYQDNKNTLPDGGEKAVIHDISWEAKYIQSKTTFSGNFSFVNIDFNGLENSSLEFAMLDGLKDGRNYLWNFDFERKLGKNVLMVLSYEGRKRGDVNPVHIGRAQVRATF